MAGAAEGFPALLALAREGDAVAWTDLYHDVAPLVLGYLRAQRLSDAEDVCGDVLLEVVRDLHRFSGDHAGFRSWVLTIAHHRLLDARRRAARRPSTPRPNEQLDHATPEVDPEHATLATVGFGQLEPALRDLTEDQRTVLLLRVVGDLSVADVARITGKRPGAVKQLQRRAAAAMRRTLDAQAEAGTVGRDARSPAPDDTAAIGFAVATVRATVGDSRTRRDAGPVDDASSAGWPR